MRTAVMERASMAWPASARRPQCASTADRTSDRWSAGGAGAPPSAAPAGAVAESVGVAAAAGAVGMGASIPALCRAADGSAQGVGSRGLGEREEEAVAGRV